MKSSTFFEQSLKKLLNNLSGKKADYWFKAFKKFLRHQNPFFLKHPFPDEEADRPFFESLDNKIDAWIKLLNTLPAICKASKNIIKELPICIDVRCSSSLFDGDNCNQFVVDLSGRVMYMDGYGSDDKIYQDWNKKLPRELMIEDFFEALKGLNEMYQGTK